MDESPTFTMRMVSKPITVTRTELEWARKHPLALFDRMLLEVMDAERRERLGR